MADGTELTSVETVREEGSWVFTIRDENGELDEAILVPCDGGVEAWINRCTHESQRLDRGFGAAIRDGEIVCPRHGSMFDACTGYCDNGPAAETTLPSVEIAVEDGAIYLVDDDATFEHTGAIGTGGADGEDDGDGPASTSHIGF